MVKFTSNLIEGKFYLLQVPAGTTSTFVLAENIVEAKVEKLSVLARKVRITLMYQTVKPVTVWADVNTIKALVIDNVDYLENI